MRRSSRFSRTCAVLLSCAAVWPLAGASALASGYQVRSGDTLSGIAEAYGVPLSALAAQNHIANVDLVYAGQELVVPGQAAPAGPPASSSSIYYAQSGDSLWSIAALRQTTVDNLIAANPDITDPNRILVNQPIEVPGGAGGASAANGAPTVSRSDVSSLLTYYASVYGLDPALVKAVAWQESGWRQNVTSAAGAVGVMQLLPGTGDWLASDVVQQPLDVVYSTDDNIHGGVAFLRFLVDRTSSMQLAVAAYYEGPGTLKNYGVLPDAQHYVDNVMAIRAYILLYGTPPGY